MSLVQNPLTQPPTHPQTPPPQHSPSPHPVTDLLTHTQPPASLPNIHTQNGYLKTC